MSRLLTEQAKAIQTNLSLFYKTTCSLLMFVTVSVLNPLVFVYLLAVCYVVCLCVVVCVCGILQMCENYDMTEFLAV